MSRFVTTATAGSDGSVHLHLPAGTAAPGEEVRVTVEPVPSAPMTQEQWRQFILSTAGKWEGDFERPPQGDYEEREPLS